MSVSPPLKARVLLFESEHAGHQMEYLLLFARHAVLDERLCLSLVITEALLEKLQACKAWQTMEKLHRVDYFLLTEVEENRCNHPLLPLRSFWLWFTLRNYLKRIHAEYVLCMRVDHFQLALALRLPLPTLLSGILYHPSLHYPELNMMLRPCTIKERIKHIRQRLFYIAMFMNPVLHKLFTLDETFAVWGKARLVGGQKVQYLSDPAHPEIIEYADTSISRHLPKGRTIFLLFGALSRRKGVFVLLAALRLLLASERQQLCIVFAGRVVASEQQAFQEELVSLQSEDVDSCMHFDGFLPTGDITTLLHHCDVVLACYQEYVGSSGTLLWAASAGKPVLAQSFGLIGKLVTNHQLGMSIDTSSPEALAQALLELCDEKVRQRCCDREILEAFAVAHHPDVFAEKLIASMTGVRP